MGLFSKTPQPKPKIIVQGVEVSFHHEYGGWSFTYRGTEFTSFETTLTLPTVAELDCILETVESLKLEMRARIQKGLSEIGQGLRLGDGESCSVNVQNFATDKSLTVSWSDGAAWGDLGVDFVIMDNAIIDESWGD